MEKHFDSRKTLLTTSCTSALEMGALLCDIQAGDEVIMPSYTFVSTANAFVLRGAEVVFVDIDPRTMNLDADLIEDAITSRTRVIVPVHYAGVACDMDTICALARENDLKVVEDAAQAVMSRYKGRALGTIGDFGCFSFHETKNYTMGEGGALLLQDEADIERAEVIREKGTNRNQFFRGMVDKYTWVGRGSSYLPSELNAAYLYAQLLVAETINDRRRDAWNLYFHELSDLAIRGRIELPFIPDECQHNGHMFYLKTRDLDERTRLIDYLRGHGILAPFHYVPLHSSPAGVQFGRFHGEDRYTTKESERLIRLPMYSSITQEQVEVVCKEIHDFYNA